MSVEFDNPTNLSEMRKIAHEWLYYRPTIKHTPSTLKEILKNELSELYQVVIEHKSEPEVSLELGDVFFSMLAIDDGQNHEFDSDYLFFESYVRSQGISLIDLFKQIHYKNRVNYPVEFFNEMSPFYESKDAISCLRILRHHCDDNPENLDSMWRDSDIARFSLPFTDDWEFNGVFRKFIFDQLTEILKNNSTGREHIKEIQRLKEVGVWTKQPLNISDSRLSWTRLR